MLDLFVIQINCEGGFSQNSLSLSPPPWPAPLAPCRRVGDAHAALPLPPWWSRATSKTLTCPLSLFSPRSSPNFRIEAAFFFLPSFRVTAVAVELACVVPGPPRDNPAAQGPPPRSSPPPRRRNRAGRARIAVGLFFPVRRELEPSSTLPSPASCPRHRRPRPFVPGEARIFPSPLPRSLSPSRRRRYIAGHHRRPARHRARPGHRPDRPGGRWARVRGRPSARPGPTERPAPSGHTPACAPDWAGSEAGLFWRGPGLQTGLGRPVGRPQQ